MYPAIFMTADISWDPTIFDNHHEQVIKEEFITSENSDVFINSDTREIDLYATNWQSLDVDLGDLYAYDDPNLYSCIRYAHLHAKDTCPQSNVKFIQAPQDST